MMKCPLSLLVFVLTPLVFAQNGIGRDSLPYYSEIPSTNFRCEDQPYAGYYADPEAECQVFHICVRHDTVMRQFSFLCPNETVFDQERFVCVWYDGFDCTSASSLYYINEAIFEDSGEAVRGRQFLNDDYDDDDTVGRQFARRPIQRNSFEENRIDTIEDVFDSDEFSTPTLGKSLVAGGRASTLGQSKITKAHRTKVLSDIPQAIVRNAVDSVQKINHSGRSLATANLKINKQASAKSSQTSVLKKQKQKSKPKSKPSLKKVASITKNEKSLQKKPKVNKISVPYGDVSSPISSAKKLSGNVRKTKNKNQTIPKAVETPYSTFSIPVPKTNVQPTRRTQKAKVQSQGARRTQKTKDESQGARRTQKAKVQSQGARRTPKTKVQSQGARRTQKTKDESQGARRTQKAKVNSQSVSRTQKTKVESQGARRTQKTKVESQGARRTQKTKVESQGARRTQKTKVNSQSVSRTQKSKDDSRNSYKDLFATTLPPIQTTKVAKTLSKPAGVPLIIRNPYQVANRFKSVSSSSVTKAPKATKPKLKPANVGIPLPSQQKKEFGIDSIQPQSGAVYKANNSFNKVSSKSFNRVKSVKKTSPKTSNRKTSRGQTSRPRLSTVANLVPKISSSVSKKPQSNNFVRVSQNKKSKQLKNTGVQKSLSGRKNTKKSSSRKPHIKSISGYDILHDLLKDVAVAESESLVKSRRGNRNKRLGVFPEEVTIVTSEDPTEKSTLNEESCVYNSKTKQFTGCSTDYRNEIADSIQTKPQKQSKTQSKGFKLLSISPAKPEFSSYQVVPTFEKEGKKVSPKTNTKNKFRGTKKFDFSEIENRRG